MLIASVSLAGCAGYTSAASGGTGGGTGASGGGTLSASSSGIGFGNVVEGSTATQSVTVTNTGTGVVNISGATVSGGVFTVVSATPSSSLAVGQTATVQIQFAPTSMTPASGALVITSDATNSTLSIPLSGTGLEADPVFSPGNLTFDNVVVGQTSTQNVTLSNTGNMSLSVTAADLSGSGFSMSGLVLPATIAPNASTTFTVQYSPQSTAAASGSITFSDNGKHAPHSVNLNGNGVAAGSTLSANPGSLNFSNVLVGSSSSQPITLTNSGNKTITINSVTAAGTGFSVSGVTAGQSIAAGATATLVATFAPTAPGSASGSVTVNSTATNSLLAIGLSGTGTQPALTANPSSVNFGSILVGNTASVNVTLTNSGTANLSISSASASGAGFSMSTLSPQTLTPGGTAIFSVTFAPTASGNANGNVSITSTAPGSPLLVGLAGTGQTSQSTPAITSAPTANGTVGTAFSYQIAATNSPTSYGATGLPAGLSVNTSTGLISGTPTAAGTSTVTLSATNSTGTGNATLSLTISVPAPVISSATTANGTVGTAFSYQITATNSPASYGATGLPAGLSVNTSTGLISGAPTASGTSTVTLSATNSTGTGNATLTLTIANGAQLSVSPSPVAFGNVNVGSNSTKTVTLTNTGGATLNITAATITGAGYTMNLQPTSINAGANTTFTVTFTPTASGSASGSISITSNAPGSPATLALSGTGLQAQISATPSSVAFGTVTVNSTNSQPITLKNNGNTTLTFSQISVTGAGFGQTGLSTSTTIAAGASATFNATFDPSSSGTVSGSITLTTNGSPSPLVISLSGTGQTASLLLGASPTTLAFGNVLDQSSKQMTTSLTNNGNADVTISGVTVVGLGFTASGIVNGTVLTPGQSATLTVTFAPTSGGPVNAAAATITSNATNSPTIIALTGTGMHSVVLTWSASPTGGVTYNVFRGTSPGGEGTTPINTAPITTLTFTDTNVTPGTTYYYTVEAVDSGGSSDPSNEATAVIPNP